MARQTGEIKITGTIDGLCFYKMYGDHFVRMKSSLTGRRFRKDKAFEGSRRSCSLLAKASPFASLFYKNYPKIEPGSNIFVPERPKKDGIDAGKAGIFISAMTGLLTALALIFK